MALSYDITKCTPNTFQGQNDESTHYVLCVLMMVIGIGSISEKNLEEVFKRVHEYENLNGGMRMATDTETGKSTNVKLTLEEVKRFVGMTTNIFPDMTKRQWSAKYFKMLKREANGTHSAGSK